MDRFRRRRPSSCHYRPAPGPPAFSKTQPGIREKQEYILEKAYVLLEDGTWFPATARRPFSLTTGEIVFTTNLTGYQEVFTDPSYLAQLVVMTATMIGNYGINMEDMESASGTPSVSGVLVRELARLSETVRAALGRDT